jgi:hypothetical protein
MHVTTIIVESNINNEIDITPLMNENKIVKEFIRLLSLYYLTEDYQFHSLTTVFCVPWFP